MPEVTVTIGERQFDVACQEGEEHYLQSAAAMLDTEAQTLLTQIRHLTEPRMLLMAGLMLADKTAGLDDNLKLAEQKIAELEARLTDAEARSANAGVTAAAPAAEALAVIAGRVEALAHEVEAKAAG